MKLGILKNIVFIYKVLHIFNVRYRYGPTYPTDEDTRPELVERMTAVFGALNSASQAKVEWGKVERYDYYIHIPHFN